MHAFGAAKVLAVLPGHNHLFQGTCISSGAAGMCEGPVDSGRLFLSRLAGLFLAGCRFNEQHITQAVLSAKRKRRTAAWSTPDVTNIPEFPAPGLYRTAEMKTCLARIRMTQTPLFYTAASAFVDVEKESVSRTKGLRWSWAARRSSVCKGLVLEPRIVRGGREKKSKKGPSSLSS